LSLGYFLPGFGLKRGSLGILQFRLCPFESLNSVSFQYFDKLLIYDCRQGVAELRWTQYSLITFKDNRLLGNVNCGGHLIYGSGQVGDCGFK
jgi:hypothetical protein